MASPPTHPADRPSRRTNRFALVVTLVSVVPLAAIAWSVGSSLFLEMKTLREAQSRAQGNEVIGYVDINPEISFAARPADWFHDEGEETWLWAGWKGDHHDWFRVGRGEVVRGGISLPLGRDVIRTIDKPIVEIGGGLRWGRIPDSALVAGFEGVGRTNYYPVLVVEKVGAINDTIDDRPVLIAQRPIAEPRRSVVGYLASLDGRRVWMGHSGYSQGGAPVFYDRETRSLWTDRDGSLVAIAGPLKARSLPPAGPVEVLPWSSWKKGRPSDRLLVGADRPARTPGP